MLKNYIKSFLLNTFSILFYLIPKKDSECVLLSSHIPIQNIGDQALLGGSIEGLKSFSVIHVVQTGSDSPKQGVEKLGLGTEAIRFYEQFKLAFVTEKSFTETLSLLFFLARYRYCFAIGADVLDGTYSSDETSRFFLLIKKIAGARTEVTIIGSSFSKVISKETIFGVSNLPRRVRLFCRDQFSLVRISEIFKARLSADAAFLLKPKKNAYYHLECFRSGDCLYDPYTIGICMKETDLNDSHDLLGFCRTINELIEEGHVNNIVFLPHHIDDLLLCQRIKDSLRLNEDKLFIPKLLLPANEIKYLTSKCRMVITGRMHVAIAALGMGSIPVCFTYGDKFEGLLAHFDLEPERLIVSENKHNFWEVLEYCLQNTDFLRQRIANNGNKVRALALENFSVQSKV